jgi:2-keto-4-pentenoate hydratase/2-oxohepta-3-ene-1,7-dioic acid hydratase in catechol pathway
MRLASFTTNGVAGFGSISDDEQQAVDFAAAGIAADLEAFVALGDAGLAKAREAVAGGTLPMLAMSDIAIGAPFPGLRRTIMCVGKNYRDHAAEFHGSGFDSTAGATAVPDVPIIFVKHPSSVIAPGEAIVAANDPTNTVDYEGELAVIIGEPAFHVAHDDALKHVYGYTIVNDATSRELQSKHKQWFIGKSVDTFCPMGPYVVTADEVGNIRERRLQTYVNDELRQNALVEDLIFDIPTLIATISATTRLMPGDIIATGTPAGVGIGFTPPKYLHAGDRVRITIDRIGTLENPVA